MTLDHLTLEFESLRGELLSFILRMTGSVQDAEDIVQETYIAVHTKIDSFRQESSLKTWVFAIAANRARDLLRGKKRWPENVTDICREAALSDPEFFSEALHIHESSPQAYFEIKEHIALCFTCVSRSLPLEQQLALWLKGVYGFTVCEIAEIMELSEAMVKYYLHVGRQTMIRVFDHRCSLINKQGVCHQCTELSGIFNPRQDEQQALVKIKMVQDAAGGDKEHLFDLRLQIMQELDPFESGAAALQLHHLEHNRRVMEAHLQEDS
jgi:RNA polymerase sigma-70 factor (ECF subfamily)